MAKIVHYLLALTLVGAALSMPAAAQEPLEAYRIGPSDILEIIVWREQALTRPEVLVRPDGRISLPLADDIRAAGLTPMELKDEITRSLKRFVEEPKVYVIVRDPRSYTFSVLGNVTKPDRYPLLAPTTVLQGIAMAQGFNEWAHKNDIVVLRGLGPEQKRFRVVYSDVIAGDASAQNIALKPGDLIIVP